MSPCIDAMIEGIITIKPDLTVKKAMEIFEIEDIRNLPVIDEKGKLLGVFSLKNIFIKLLPSSVTMENGLNNLDFASGATPDIAARLKKLLPMRVDEVMDKNPTILYPDTATWEGLRMMATNGSPVCLVNENTGEFVGMISYQSMLGDLNAMIHKLNS